MKKITLGFATIILLCSSVMAQAQTVSYSSAGIGNGGKISNGIASLSKTGAFKITYDYEFEAGKKNRVEYSGTGCAPNEFCALGSWRVIKKHKDYSGPMTGGTPPRPNVREGKLIGFSGS